MSRETPVGLGPTVAPAARPAPILALDVGSADEAFALVARVPRASFFKVGLQLYTAAGPDIVRRLKGEGFRVFLDLKFHDIPNTVAGAVRSAGCLGVDLLTVHASGGPSMLLAAADAARSASAPTRIFAVTVLTSLGTAELARSWGRTAVSAAEEAARLAALADEAGADGVVTSVHEVAAIRAATRPDFPVLTPGIRLEGDGPGDQSRIATPADAARAGVDYCVIGRTVTAAPDPAEAYERVLAEISPSRVGS
ncbi:MAG: orotidine-5'-phosphate decarboxylase [Gemmatimonadota bacterium]